MKSLLKLALVVAAGAASTVAMAQDTKVPVDARPRTQPTTPGQPPKPPQPGDPKAPKAPEGMPDMDAMMEAYMKAAQPGPMHKHLQANVGEWHGKTTMWMMPGMPPSESTCTTVIKPLMGDRFTMSETKGEFDMGGMKFPFEGFGIYGYNNTTKQFESTWCDNMGTMLMHLTGTLSADGKVLTWNTKFTDPATGKESWMREVETQKGPDAWTLEMFGPTPDGKGEHKMMVIEYTRKGGADAKKDARPAKPAGQ